MVTGTFNSPAHRFHPLHGATWINFYTILYFLTSSPDEKRIDGVFDNMGLIYCLYNADSTNQRYSWTGEQRQCDTKRALMLSECSSCVILHVITSDRGKVAPNKYKIMYCLCNDGRVQALFPSCHRPLISAWRDPRNGLYPRRIFTYSPLFLIFCLFSCLVTPLNSCYSV